VRVVVDLPDALAIEVEQRLPNAKWQRIIVDAITFAMAMADAASPGGEPSDDVADDQPPAA
jgi:hypothetical protein